MTDLSTLSDADLTALYKRPAASPLAHMSDEDLKAAYASFNQSDEPSAAELAAAEKPAEYRIPTRRQAPPVGPENLKGLDDLVRSLASGATFGLADEIVAGGKSLLGGKSYSDNLADERARDAQISGPMKTTGEIAGGLATGGALARGGATLLNVSRPTIGNMALRGAGEGAAYGAAHGFGHGEGTQDRLEQAGKGALVGGLAGGVTGGVAGGMAQRAGRQAIPSTEALKDEANALYAASENAGVKLEQSSFANAIDDIAATARKQLLNAKIHPESSEALATLQAAKGSTPTLAEVDQLRQILGDAAGSQKAGDRRLANLMKEKLDNYIEKLSPKDLLGGDAAKGVDALTEARGLWGRFRKSEVLDELVHRASVKAAQFGGSGYENALRREFQGLALNPKRLRSFSADERAAIEQVAKGGPIDNLMRRLGKFAPTGVVSTALGAGTSALTGLPTYVLPMAGGAGRAGATAATVRNVERASDLVRAGGNLPAYPLSPMQRGLLEAGLITEGEEGAPAFDAIRGGLLGRR